MKRRTAVSILATAVLLASGMALATRTPAAAQCLSRSECDALKTQLREFREQSRPIRERARELRQRARELTRGSEERKTLNRQFRELRREFRQLRRNGNVREIGRAVRAGCRNC